MAGGAGTLAAPGAWIWQLAARVDDVPRDAGPPRGDEPPAFEARYAAEAEALTRLCRRLLGRDGGAEDAVQEVFLRARQGYATYDARLSFRSWLLSIASHYCIDVLRRRSLEGRIFSAADLDAGELGAAGPSPLGHALDAERRERLLGAIDALPDRYRVPLALRYFQELDYAGIAEALALSRENVGVLLFRARRMLREALEEEPS